MSEQFGSAVKVYPVIIYAAKYLNKTFKYFDDKIGSDIECVNSFDQLYDELYGEET